VLTGFANGAIMGQRFGSAPVGVVALHGWQRTHHDFAAVLDGASGAVALDLPGFGATPPPPDPWGSEAYAEAVLPILDEIDDPVVVLGHSFGGRVAIQLALLAPEKIRGLVLTGVPQLAPRSEAGRPNRVFQAIRAARHFGLVSEKRLDDARARYGSRDYREADGVIRGVLVRVLQERYAPLLPQINCGVELVWGALDTVAALDGAQFAEDALAHGHLVVLAGIGHMVPTEAPDALRSAIGRLGL
jgi:pimeloyl-ACP methyl ester carboxylesterase